MLATLIIKKISKQLRLKPGVIKKMKLLFSGGSPKIKHAFYKTNFLFKISFLIFKLILQPHQKFRILENSEIKIKWNWKK